MGRVQVALMKERRSLSNETIQAAQAGDRSAQSELIRESQDDLYRFCFYLCGDPVLAQDLTQETFVRVLEKLSRLEDPGSFKSFLLRAAKNLFLDHIKSHKNAPTVDLNEISDKLSLEGDDPGLVLQVREALLALNPDERIILLLVDLEKHSYAEAAKILGLSEDVVTTRVFRARQSFQKKFN